MAPLGSYAQPDFTLCRGTEIANQAALSGFAVGARLDLSLHWTLAFYHLMRGSGLHSPC